MIHHASRYLIALLLLVTAVAPLAAQGGAEKCTIQITEPLGYFIDLNSHNWEAKARLAPDSSVGDWLHVMAAVVSQTQHATLKQHMDEAQVTKNWTPILMPKTDCVASMLIVRSQGRRIDPALKRHPAKEIAT
jgi:hypothetical protein